MPLSQHKGLRIAADLFAVTCIASGINALLRPASALSFFHWDYPTTTAQSDLVDSLLYVYAIRDILMGASVYISKAYGTQQSLGLTLLANCAVAWGDGLICWTWGKGHWGHWTYAPIYSVVAAAILGAFD
ncbi:hypothetical protein BJX64DRAFT_228273 [Aspergillus heterothallicus]